MPGCQLHNSQCSLECVAQTLSLLTPRADIDQCPQCPNPVKVQCSRHRECQARIEMSQAANQRWEESEETNEKRGNVTSTRGLKLRCWQDWVGPCVSRFALLKSPLRKLIDQNPQCSLWAVSSGSQHPTFNISHHTELGPTTGWIL